MEINTCCMIFVVVVQQVFFFKYQEKKVNSNKLRILISILYIHIYNISKIINITFSV